jgi:hypothetical protein
VRIPFPMPAWPALQLVTWRRVDYSLSQRKNTVNSLEQNRAGSMAARSIFLR